MQVQDLPPGSFHIDIAEIQAARGRLCRLAAIDRVTRCLRRAPREGHAPRTAADIAPALIKAVPCTIHTVPTDNGTPLTSPGNTRSASSGIRHTMEQEEQFRERPGRTHEPDAHEGKRRALPPWHP